jgi:hypothetical protein
MELPKYEKQTTSLQTEPVLGLLSPRSAILSKTNDSQLSLETLTPSHIPFLRKRCKN